MNLKLKELILKLNKRFVLLKYKIDLDGTVSLILDSMYLIEICLFLKKSTLIKFNQLIDIVGIDFLTYGIDDVKSLANNAVNTYQTYRFGVIYNLLSMDCNIRIRLNVLLKESELILPSIVKIWPSANWAEREVFDLYGVYFLGHPDLRRILTDYNFHGYPLRKDFPINGEEEIVYDIEKKRIVKDSVSIENREFIPKIIRNDSRYIKI